MDFSAFLPMLLGALLGALVGGFGSFLAIRVALADLQARVANLEDSVKRAHSRIDDARESSDDAQRYTHRRIDDLQGKHK